MEAVLKGAFSGLLCWLYTFDLNNQASVNADFGC